MLKKVILICFFFFLSKIFFSQKQSCDTLFLKKIIKTLSSSSFEGRYPGTEGINKAKYFIINNLDKKIKILVDTFNYSIDSNFIVTENIIGILDNKADSFIIISAHYDHIGYGGKKSRSLKKSVVHPGADDNASGVSVVLSLANYYTKNSVRKIFKKKYNFIFIFFSGHEDGLYGSNSFVNKYKSFLKKTSFVINFDMVGRLNTYTRNLKLISNNILFFEKFFNDNNFNLKYSEDFLNTDISAFIKENIKSISLTTGLHEDYHKVTDTYDKINYIGICQILKFVINLINEYSKQRNN